MSWISSVSDSQDEILKGIIALHCPDGFDLDPTYSKGAFYKNIPEPRYKSDSVPLADDVMECDCRDLPFSSGELNSIIFDPPFVAAIPTGNSKRGIIRERFGYYRNVQGELWELYRASLKEFYRILKYNGVLVVKSQDTIDSGKQCLSHIEIINYAYRIGFYPIDIFILIARSRLRGSSWRNQQHARKYHSYFLVFKKRPPKVCYTKNYEEKKYGDS